MSILVFSGNLGRDAESKMAGSTPIVRWAVPHTTKGRDSADHVIWIDVTIWKGWDSQAAARKGDRVTVAGELTTREYDGKVYYSVSAQPWQCECLVRRDREQAAPQRQPESRPQHTEKRVPSGGDGWGGNAPEINDDLPF